MVMHYQLLIPFLPTKVCCVCHVQGPSAAVKAPSNMVRIHMQQAQKRERHGQLQNEGRLKFEEACCCNMFDCGLIGSAEGETARMMLSSVSG